MPDYQCPSCSRPVTADAAFCSNCGARLTLAPKTEPVTPNDATVTGWIAPAASGLDQPSRPWWKRWWGISALAVVGLLVLGGIGNALGAGKTQGVTASPAPSLAAGAVATPLSTATPTPIATPEETDKAELTADPTAEPTLEPTAKTVKPKPTPQLTAEQENAIGSAEDYLDYSAFSRAGLIKQLKFEGYSTAAATFAVDHITVDWKEQAYLSAMEYLDYSHFSRSGLISQLKFEGFTTKQATYGVTKAGL
jgi:hypothetical protein